MHTYYLHLGSNQGEKKDFLQKALEMISTKIGEISLKSSIYETEPWGMKEQDNFLNMAIEVKSTKSPEDVIQSIKSIESVLGTAKEVKWGPRSIDIDVLYCDDQIMNSSEITIPHPHIQDRNFVLIPLMEIAGDFTDPVHKMTIDELYDICKDTGEVFIFEE
jgi:2-amino-4-hydroxy-6-hydroxymethyldihydropteridine diphosphokinase